LLESLHARAQVAAAARELERRTIGAFFDVLSGRTTDPRLIRMFSTQSSGWRVPWSESAPSKVPEGTTHVLHDVTAAEHLSAPAAFVRLGRPRSLRKQQSRRDQGEEHQLDAAQPTHDEEHQDDDRVRHGGGAAE